MYRVILCHCTHYIFIGYESIVWNLKNYIFLYFNRQYFILILKILSTQLYQYKNQFSFLNINNYI